MSSDRCDPVSIPTPILLPPVSTKGLSNFLISINLPPIPLVPVSSSQAIVGAVIGIGLLKGGKEVQWNVAGKIAIGWAILPIIAALISFVVLFVLQNILNQSISL